MVLAENVPGVSAVRDRLIRIKRHTFAQEGSEAGPGGA
jgi:hypothetical protein